MSLLEDVPAYVSVVETSITFFMDWADNIGVPMIKASLPLSKIY